MLEKILSCVLALAFAFGASSAGEKPAERPADGIIPLIKKAGVLRVAQVSAPQPPFFYTVKTPDGKEKWVGFEMDLAQTIADKLGVKLEIVRLGTNYNEVCEYVNQGKADLGVSNLSDTPKRREIVDFTKPYIISRVAMIVNLDALEKSGIDAIEPKDLNRPEVKVSVGKGISYESVVDEQFPKAQKVYVQNGIFEDMSKPVVAGEAHALVDDGLRLNLGMSTHPELAGRIYLHVFDEYEDPLSICLPLDQPSFRKFLEDVLDEIDNVEPTTLEYLVEKYMK